MRHSLVTKFTLKVKTKVVQSRCPGQARHHGFPQCPGDFHSFLWGNFWDLLKVIMTGSKLFVQSELHRDDVGDLPSLTAVERAKVTYWTSNFRRRNVHDWSLHTFIKEIKIKHSTAKLMQDNQFKNEFTRFFNKHKGSHNLDLGYRTAGSNCAAADHHHRLFLLPALVKQAVWSTQAPGQQGMAMDEQWAMACQWPGRPTDPGTSSKCHVPRGDLPCPWAPSDKGRMGFTGREEADS